MGPFKSGRGGPRKGSGRPAGATSENVDPRFRRVPVGVRLPAWKRDWIRAQKQTATEIVETALDAYYALWKHEPVADETGPGTTNVISKTPAADRRRTKVRKSRRRSQR